MEPRPPRAATPGGFDRPGQDARQPGAGGSGQPSLPPAGGPAYDRERHPQPGPEGYGPTAQQAAYAGPIPLVPRDERRRRRALRTAALGLLALLAIGVGGYLLRDRLLERGDGQPLPVAASPAASPRSVAATDADPAPADPGATAPAAGANEPASVLSPPTPTAGAGAATTERTAAPTATRSPDPGDTPPEEEADAADAPSDQPVTDRSVDELLPADADVPDGLAPLEEGELDRDQVLAALGDSEEADALLTDTGWAGNAFKNFQTADGETTENGSTGLTVSAHQFADGAAAGDALVYFSDYIITNNGYVEVEGEEVGDGSRWLRQEAAEGNTAVVYVQLGSAMIRIGGFSPAGDPAPDVAAVAATILQA